MIKVTISTIFHVLAFYKDNPFPKHPWFLKNPRIWYLDIGDCSSVCLLVNELESYTQVLKLKLHVKTDTKTILILVGKFFCSLSYFYSIILRKAHFFLHLKYAITEVVYIAPSAY